MKKTISVSLGRRCFILEEDAYSNLSSYLDSFKADIVRSGNLSVNEVMEDLELRIAELFTERLMGREVVNASIVNGVISQLGMPGGEQFSSNTFSQNNFSDNSYQETPRPTRRLFRDIDMKAIGGVCSGLAHYFNIDVAIVRVAFVVACILGLAGFWVYIIFWIILPQARTPLEKCEMYGLPATPENINRFTYCR